MQVRDLEHAHLTTQHNLQTVQDELARTQAANKQAAGEEKELQARLAAETEERERATQELHQLRKQVRATRHAPRAACFNYSRVARVATRQESPGSQGKRRKAAS